MPPVGVNRVDWRASSYPDFIQNYFLLKHMFYFFDNPDECRNPGFLRGNIYTSCISIFILDHFANKSNTFLSPSLTLPFPPISSSTSSNPGFQDCAINGTLANWGVLDQLGALGDLCHTVPHLHLLDLGGGRKRRNEGAGRPSGLLS